MMQQASGFAAMVGALAVAATAHGDILTVDPSGGGSHTTIQSAIDAASSGDEIVVLPGVYFESLNFLGKAIHVRTTDPVSVDVQQATVVDGSEMATVVTFASGEPADAILQGFTLRRGRTDAAGAGIFCANHSSPTIRFNRILGGFAVGNGGGIHVGAGCTPTIDRNEVFGNRSEARGAGVSVLGGSPVIVRNRIEANVAGCSAGGGVYLGAGSDATVLRANRIMRNFSRQGGGLAVEASGPTIDRNWIIGNSALPRGGGVSLFNADASLFSNVIAGNRSPIASIVDCNQSDPVFRGNTIVGNWATDAAGMLFIANSQADLVGNIIAHTRAGIAIQALAGSSVTASFNDFYLNADGDTAGTVTLVEGNLFVDPELVAIGFWEFGGAEQDEDEEPPCGEEERRQYIANYFGPGAIRGFAHYRLRPDRERFDVGVTSFPQGVHDIAINGDVVGQIFVDAGGNGNLEFDTNDGNFPSDFPEVLAGDEVSIGEIGIEILRPEIVGVGDIWRAGDTHLGGDAMVDVGPLSNPPVNVADVEGQPRLVGSAVDIGADEKVSAGVGDADGDGDVDFADAQRLQRCSTTPGFGLLDPDCAAVDLDGDADVDRDDWELWMDAFTGPN